MRDIARIYAWLYKMITESPLWFVIHNVRYFLNSLVKYPSAPVLVAEGDSWFDYDFTAMFLDAGGRDLLDHLGEAGRYSILRMGIAGDTLVNEAYGKRIRDAAEAVRVLKPAAFLFSGGGNDFAGQGGCNLVRLLTPEGLDRNKAQICIGVQARDHYEAMIAAIRAVAPSLPIFVHGYAYARPDGRAVGLFPGHPFAGPWLKPGFDHMGVPNEVRQGVIIELIDMFNAMLDALAQTNDGVYHIDLRPVLEPTVDDWANELHPSNRGFHKVAECFNEKIAAVLSRQIIYA